VIASRLAIVSIITAVAALILVFELLRRRRLREKYAAIWVVIALGTLIVAAFPQILRWVADLIGIQTPSNLLFFGSLIVLFAVSLQLSRALSGIVGTAVTDPTSGFRLVHRRALALFAEHYPEEYLGDTVEALVVAHRAGLTITQVPVSMRVRSCGRASTDPVRSAVYLLRVVVAVGLAMVRRVPR